MGNAFHWARVPSLSSRNGLILLGPTGAKVMNPGVDPVMGYASGIK
jgi:hypothetical protein